MSDIIKTANVKYAFLFDGVKDYVPLTYTKMGSTTLIPKEVMAFSLKSIDAGDAKDTTPDFEVNKDKYGGLLVRACIGYAMMAQLGDEKNFAIGCFRLSNVINGMLNEAGKYVDLRPTLLKDSLMITFQRPGSTNDFFRELENNAGYELRLYINWNKEDKK